MTELKTALLAVLVSGILVSVGGCAVDSSSDSGSSAPSSDISVTVDDDLPTATSRGLFCGTEDPDNETMNQLSGQFNAFQRTFKNRQKNDSTVEIPVVFHVIPRGSGADEGAVSDSVLREQINILNEAYSGNSGGVPTPFRFSLARVNRVDRPEWHLLGPGTETEVAAKMELREGGASTLNVYVASIDSSSLGGATGEVLGYASLPVFYGVLPFFDGIVLSFKALPGGSLERYNLGHVLVHEVGHWLGLLHTFQGECDGLFDDLVTDTPRERIPGQGEFCPVGRDSCTDQTGMDPVHNHMTYTEDGCRFEFTEGQIQFMRFNSVVFRQMGL